MCFTLLFDGRMCHSPWVPTHWDMKGAASGGQRTLWKGSLRIPKTFKNCTVVCCGLRSDGDEPRASNA